MEIVLAVLLILMIPGLLTYLPPHDDRETVGSDRG